jgi:hypothetical protein
LVYRASNLVDLGHDELLAALGRLRKRSPVVNPRGVAR